MPELLLGCGASRVKRPRPGGSSTWNGLVTCDMNADHSPDVIHNLEHVPYPWPTDFFDEVHAYEVMEHLGSLGDFRSFFAQFQELWRILKPGGYLVGTSPSVNSPWLWGDPGHTRAIQPESFAFLDQEVCRKNRADGTAMTDYRFCYSGDLRRVIWIPDADGTFFYVLKAVK